MSSLVDSTELAGLDTLAASQAGVVGRGQLVSLGIPRAYVRGELRARRWRRALPRTYVVFTGPMPFLTRAWAAVLYAGEDAVVSHRSAAFLQGLADREPGRVEIIVRHGHRVPSRPAVQVRQSRRVEERRHPSRTPPQTRLEETVLDLTEQAPSEDQVIDVVLRACQRRLTTAARLGQCARGRRRLRWRRLVGDLLAEVREGVQSALERRYFRNVERAHGLPRGMRNRAEGSGSSRRYRDVRYRRWHLVVELDGRVAHPDELAERDSFRDNELLAQEDVRTLRYGWRAVTRNSCAVAEQVAAVLRLGGWTGSVRPCGPSCSVQIAA